MPKIQVETRESPRNCPACRQTAIMTGREGLVPIDRQRRVEAAWGAHPRTRASGNIVMSRVAIQWKRQPDGDFKAIGVWFGTPKALQSRVLPGVGMENWFRTIHSMVSPLLIENGTEQGTWEDTIEYFLDALSNGHDLMVTEVKPEITLDRTYAKWVLELEGTALNRWKPTTMPTVTATPVIDLLISDGPPSSTPTLPDA